MILFCVFILIPLITATPYEGPSYRSSVMEGDKPILRMVSDQEGYESDDEDSEGIRKPMHATKDPEMVKDLSTLIGWLMDTFGYDLGSLQGRRNKDAVYSQVFDQTKKALRDSSIYIAPDEQHMTPDRAPDENPQSQTDEPSWKTDLKEFIKNLISRFGKDDPNRYTKTVSNSLEKKYDVTISDTDVDQSEPKALRYRTPEGNEETPLPIKKKSL